MRIIWKYVCSTYFQIGVNIIGLPEIIRHDHYDPIGKKVKTSKYF